MSHVFQVGAGSGGIVVLDLVARDPRVTGVTLIEFDAYEPHNVHRHLFPPSAVGRAKGELAAEWVRGRRPDLAFEWLAADLTDPARQAEFARPAAACDAGVCAVDNEPAKYAFDALMRAAGKPWTLGEVLSGGIGGWVHTFTPGGPCYGCVASHLKRSATEEAPAPAPDYSNPGGPVPTATVPASKASIGVIASLHAVATLALLANPERQRRGDPNEAHPVADAPGSPAPFTSLLFTLARVPGVFEEAFRTYRFRVPKLPGCLVCGGGAAAAEDLDVAVDEALDRLGPA